MLLLLILLGPAFRQSGLEVRFLAVEFGLPQEIPFNSDPSMPLPANVAVSRLSQTEEDERRLGRGTSPLPGPDRPSLPPVVK